MALIGGGHVGREHRRFTDALYHRYSGIIVIRAKARNLDKPFPKLVPALMIFYSEVI
jgi:hypothetical protein